MVLERPAAVFLQNTAALSLRLVFVFFRHSPVWHPRLSMGDVSQRTLSVCHASVYIKRAGFFFYPAMGYDSETNPLFTDFCGNLPLRPAISFLVSQISGLFHSPDPDFPASFLLHRLAGPVPFSRQRTAALNS